MAGGLNAYGFAKGNPLTYRDPFGLCATGGSGGGEAGTEDEDRAPEETECEKLATAAADIAGQAGSITEFGAQLGSEVAGTTGVRDLLAGGRNVLSANVGGYRAEFGGAQLGQARHFAASAFAYIRYGGPVAHLGFWYNETFRPGASKEDMALSVAAFRMSADMVAAHQRGVAWNAAGMGAYVRTWISEKVCER